MCEPAVRRKKQQELLHEDTALILLSAIVLAKTENSGVYPNGCPKDWSVEKLLPHPDCHKFYQCWDGKLVEHSCAADLYFSVEANQCEWSEVVDCTATIVPEKESDEADNNNIGAGNCDPSKAPEICAAEGSDSVLVAHEKCNKYYICNHGKPVPRRCQVGLFFNPKTDRCDWPENVNCGDRVIPDAESVEDDDSDSSISNENNGNGDNDNSSDDNGASDSGSSDSESQDVGAGNCDPSKAPEICAADDSDSVLVAHEKCNKYYICNHGKPVPRRCQAGLFFNPKTDRCDWPKNVECGDRVVPGGEGGGNDNGDGSNSNENNDNGGGDNGGSGNDSQNVGAGNCDPSKAPEICAADDSDSVLVAHETCNKYYICNHGKPVPRRCQAGLFFNPKTDRCDWPENVECGDRFVPGGEGGGNDNGDGGNDNGGSDNGGSGNDNQNVGAGNCDPSKAPEICAADDSDSVLVAHEKCNKYYICNHGKPVPRRCQVGLYFNPKTDRCDWPENVECGDRVVPGGEGGGNDNGDGGNSNENNDNGGGDNGGSGNDSQNVGAGNCDPSKAPEICAADDSDSVLVAHEKCNKYYICNHGKPVPRRCQAGLFFNPKTDRCDWPENVECGDRVVPGGEGGGNDNGDGGDSNENNDNGGGDNGGSGNDSQNVGAGNCDPSKAPEICAADDSDSVLVAHEKCNKYYICNHGKPVPRRCQAGLFFNPKTDRCDWPKNVECGDRVVPGGEGGSNDNGDGGNSNENNDNGGNDNGGGDNGGSDNGGSGNGDGDNGGSGNDNQNVGAGNCDPSKAPEICAADDSDSVLVAHEKCNKYYICNHGKPVPRRCQAGLFFNPKTDRCDWPENVECGDRVVPGGEGGGNDNGDGGNSNENNDNGGSDNGGGDNDGSGNDNQNVGAGNCDPSKAPEICAADDSDSVLVAHEKCNKYYICAHGKPVARPCQAGLFFNPKTDRCDWPENVECGDRVVPGGEGGGNDNGDGSNSNENNDNGGSGNDNQNVGAGNCDPSKAPEICAADDSDSVLVAHEKCNKYYICNHGKPVPRRCQAGLFFNPKTDRCDWPKNVECGDRVVPGGEGGGNDNGDGGNSNENNDNGGSDNGGGDNGGSGNDNQNVGAGNCDPSKAPEICAADDSDSVLVAHEKCNKYYICAHGKPVARPCQAGLFFNPKTDRCDWPENVECGDRVVPGGEGGGNDNGDGGNSNENNDNGGGDNGGSGNDNQNVGAGNCDPSKAPEICAADDSDSVLVAHEKCNKYYICAHGKPVARPCQAGLFFNPKTDRCDWPENVECGDRVVPGGEGGGNDNGDGSNSNENNDNGGSDNGGGDNGGSGNDSQNVGAGNCDPSKAPEICAADDSDSVLVAHEKCNKYYICNHGKPVPRRCQAGLFFNPKTDRCDWPKNVECGDRVVPGGEGGGNDNGDGGNSNENNDNGGSDNGGGDNGGGDNGGSGNDNQNVGAGNCDPSKAPEICAADDSDSVLVAHEKCNKYYICAHGKPVARPCQAGLFFNPKTDRCDWPENVECGDRVVPGGEGGGNDNGDGSNSNENNDNGGSDNGGGDNGGSGNDSQNVGAGNCDPSKAPEICAADDSDSVLVAHEKCNKYYICAHGKPVARPCQAGLFFNPKTDRCDWPENVECGDRVVPGGEGGGNDNGDGGNSNENNDNGGSDNGGGDNGGSGNDNQNVGAGNCDPSKAPEICAADDSDSVLVAHEKCNKYYICNHGKPVPRRCQAGLFFNPKTDRCDWPENVECGDRVVPGGEGGGNDNGGDGNSNENNDNGGSDNGGGDNGGSGNDNQNVGAGNCDPSKAPEICAADDSDSVLVAHEKCNKYYICNHGKPVPRRCQAGLFFNPKTDRCDWPENVECGDRVVPGGEGGGNDNGDGGNSNENNDNGGSDNDGGDNVGECNCDPSKAPEICAAEGSDDVLVAHEKCNKFYVCAHGKPFTMRCQVGLLFNPRIERCDWPENVDCGDRVIPGGENEDNNGNDNGGNDNGGNDNSGNENGDNGGNDNDNQNVGECNCDPSKAPEICSAEGSDDVLVAHEKCNKFYVCAHGKPFTMRCQVGLLFNPKIERCDWPENVVCGDRLIPDGKDEDSNDGNDNGDNDSGGNDNGGNDNGGNDNSSNENNDSDNGGTDNDNQNVGECNCDPSKAPEICAADGSDDVLVAHEKCNKFYVCANGKPVSLRCPANLLYNPHIKECDWPENVDCSDKVSPDTEDNNNGDSGNGNVGAGNNDPSLAPIICADEKSNGVFVAHELCTKFYTCSNGKPVTLRCPANLFFNPSIDECDWPQYVNCGNRLVPSGFEASLNKHSKARRTLMRWL